MRRHHEFHIGGCWRPAVSARRRIILDSSTEEPLAEIALAGTEDVESAVAAAVSALDDGWGRSDKRRRLAVLRRIIAGVEAKRELLAAVVSAEMGAPIAFARNHQVSAAVNHLRATLAAADAAEDDAPISPDRPRDRVRWEPMGVAALITPWNWPLNQIALKLGGAVAAGVTMVLKPSEIAPLSPLLLAEIVIEALAAEGAPDGVFNHLNGDGETGATLAAHPAVDVVSFTGSTTAGLSVAAAAARRLARTTLELGGKSPNLLFEDCDVDTAVRQGVAHCFRNTGQSCNAASRMLVARPIYAAAVAAARRAAEATVVGPPASETATLGPLVSERQWERVQAYIRSGVDEGATLVVGGPGKPDGLKKGFFARPTVFADVAPSMRIFREEIFGPVLVMAPFDDEDHAVTLANHGDYGLAAYVQTSDLHRADRVARRLQAGMVQVNGVSRAPGAPFGGRKLSGLGREGGLWGVRAFQEVKSISGAAAT